MFRLHCVGVALALFGVSSVHAQLSATDDFEGYTGSPVGAVGGAGDWTTLWGYNSQTGGGVFLSTAGKIDGAQSVGLYGLGSASGESISRGFPACTNPITLSASLRADYSVTNASLAPANNCRVAFTIRSENDPNHFSGQRLSFYFAAGQSNLLWYDGVDRTSAVPFIVGHVYDLVAALNPTNRAYAFVISNRNTAAQFSYAGTWTTGAAGDPLGSVAFLVRGPAGAGNDAFLDDVFASAPEYASSPLSTLPIREGALWRYHKGVSTPPLQGTNQWYRPEYNDAAWLGPEPSGFGYGDCDDATALADMQGNYISLYTRTTFRVQNPANISALTLAADFDDGFIAYLNGSEIARLNLPTGSVTRHTAATGSHESSRGNSASNPNPKAFYAVDPSLLVAGTNVLAVAGHNVSTNSTDLTLIVELYTNSSLLRGPFIQMPDSGPTAAVVWRTAALGDSVVEYGLDLSYGQVVSNGVLTRDHTVKLSGLIPGTSYVYRVRSNGEVLSEGNTFRTRPAADQPVRVLVMGDHGQGTPQMYTIASLINARTDFDAVFTVGDNIYGVSPCAMEGMPGWYDPFWFQLYAPTMRRVATFPALGNHDWDTAAGQYLVDYFRLPTNGPAHHIGKNYSFEFGNLHVIVIDTEPYEDNNASAINEINSWIDSDLAAATQRWRVALLHRPPYTSLGNHGENPRVKEHIVPRLKAGGVHVVFQGHNHFYERINAIDGVHYITTGAAGAGLYALSTIQNYSAVAYNARHSYTVLDVQGGRMSLQQFNDLNELIDAYMIDIGPPFVVDGLLDDPAWLRASHGLKLYAAIYRHTLYVATQDAGEGSDHFVYVSSALATQRPANWAKSGTVMQWGAFLADENDSGYHGWFDADGATLTNLERRNSMTSGLNNNGTNENGVLEGTLDLSALFGSFPARLYLAAAPYATTNGGHLLPAFQVPAGNGDGNIDSNEVLLIHPRDIALDLPVPLAATNAPAEAGMWRSLDGSLSYSPSDLTLTYSWLQLAGPTGEFDSAHAAQPSFRLLHNVSGVETARLALVVHDGRFAETVQVVAAFYEMLDTDGDGLSDQEEQTGMDNPLTSIHPNGHVTNQAIADSDGDGVQDGFEAIAGTDPNDPISVFKLVESAIPIADGILVKWSSVSGRVYNLWSSTNTLAAWTLVASNLTAIVPLNSYTAALQHAVDSFAVECVAP